MKNRNLIIIACLIIAGLISACSKQNLEPEDTGNYPDTGYVKLNPNFTYVSIQTLCIYPHKVLTVDLEVPDSNYTYRWLDNNSSNPLRNISSTGGFNLETTSIASNLKDTFYFEVDYCNPRVFVASSFSPNGDGINDLWFPYHYNIESIHWEIRNEEGIKLFETDDLIEKWDGRLSNDVMAQVGFYTYYIKYNTPTQTGIILTGYIELLR